MPAQTRTLTVRLEVVVTVDSGTPEMVEAMSRELLSLTATDVVAAEVQANLESVAYVRSVSVRPVVNSKEESS